MWMWNHGYEQQTMGLMHPQILYLWLTLKPIPHKYQEVTVYVQINIYVSVYLSVCIYLYIQSACLSLPIYPMI